MHIPENYLSPATCGVMTAVMVPVWAYAIKKVKDKIPKEKMALLGICAAFSFLGMMFNVPLPGGTTGHAVGGTLIAIILGPEAACISVTIALLIQALLFGDGGILAFGANCFNMAFLLPFAGYGVYKLLQKLFKNSEKTKYVSAALGSYVGLNLAALAAAIEFGIQPSIAHDAAGNALYCPYGLSVSIPAMMIGHLTIFGLAEAIFTVAIFAFVSKTDPGAIKTGEKTNNKALYILLGVLVVLTPLGLLAEGTAWGEWGVDEIHEVTSKGVQLGYTPAGMTKGFSWESIMPDYTIGTLPDILAYILSAVIGTAILVIVFRLIAAAMKSKTDYSKKSA